MSNPFEEVAEAFEEVADAMEEATEESPLMDDEEQEGDPEVSDLSVDIGDQPEYTFPSVRETAEEMDMALAALEDAFGTEMLSTEGFWAAFSDEADVDIPRGGLVPPSMESDDGPSPIDIIQATDPETVAEKTPGEGEVDAQTDAGDIETVTEDRFTQALSQVRSLDQKLDRLDEAQVALGGAQGAIGEQLEALQEDRDTVEGRMGEPDTDDELLAEAMSEIDEQMQVGMELIEEADHKIERIQERGEALLSDRNEYRGEVKALYQAAQQSGDDGLVGELTTAYRGYRLRSPQDVPFRPDIVRHILSRMRTYQSRGQLPVEAERLVEDVIKVWEYDPETVEAGLGLLRVTGEVWVQPDGLTFSPLTGGP